VLYAFRGTTYPGDDNLSNSRREEAEDEVGPLKGKRWNKLRYADLANCQEALVWMTPAAFRYYLPAFLIAAVRYREVLPRLFSVVIFMVSPRLGRRCSVTSFSSEQRDAIKAVLQHLYDAETDYLRKAEVFAALQH
jgi:hypothetical protein